MSKRKSNKSLPERPRDEERFWRINQVAVQHKIKPKDRDRNACRKNKGRHNREDY